MTNPRRSARRGGSVVAYTVIAVPAMMALATLTIDYGRHTVAKVQLQDAVDAAARYASTGLSDGTFLNKAQNAAAENNVDGTPLTLLASDVESGTWDATTRVFSAGGGSPNAVRITGRRTAARGTAISLLFGRAIGINSADVTASAVATYSGSEPAYNVVGLTAVNLTGSGLIRRWSSESGTVEVATNGSTSVPWGCYIYGNLNYRTTAPSEPGNGITGSNTSMTSDLSYAVASIPSDATNLAAFNVDWSGRTLAAGNYRCSSINIGGGGTLNITGDVNLYCTGNATLGNGATINTGGTARKFTIYMSGTNPQTIDFNLSSSFYMIVYGPTTTMNLTGSSPMIGSAVVKTLNISGGANLNYSAALPPPTSGGGGTAAAGSVTTVK